MQENNFTRQLDQVAFICIYVFTRYTLLKVKHETFFDSYNNCLYKQPNEHI